jgi:hypothetical protein
MKMDKQIKKKLQERGVVVLLGMYGMGKERVIDRLVQEWESDDSRVVRVRCKGLPMPTEDDFPVLCGYKNWTRLHAG